MHLHVGGVETDVCVWPVTSEDWRASAWKLTPMGPVGSGCFNISNAERYDGQFLHVGGITADIRCYASEPDHDGNGWVLELTPA
jgi:hypothetical protein